jgi:hypothetical protein
MGHLEGYDGAWVGSNAFRLMPNDPPHVAPISATVSHAANGDLTQVAYSWTHPDDGAQDGLLVLGPGGEPGTVAAFWGDSWHQKPEPRTLAGTRDGGAVIVGYAYSGEWRWEIALGTPLPDRLTLRMSNVVPASAATDEIAAGAYAAMSAELRRAS